MNALFLTAATGGGHAKAAEAVMECMNRRISGSKGSIVDSLKCISPMIEKLVVGAYLQTVKSTPQIYGTLYRLSELDENISELTKSFNYLLSYRICDFIGSYRPSVIVCTHTFPLQMVSNLKKKGRLSVPVVGIVTDFANHTFWKLDHIDAFVVAHPSIKQEMVRMGISEERVHAFGIPVSQRFLQKGESTAIRKELGLQNNRLTVLLMGGSLGFGHMRTVYQSLLESKRDIQILAVTGWNQKLKRQLESMSRGYGKETRIFGYTDRISDLMDISDILITKPGGMTVSEALVKQLPLLILSPIPGQEERNARFLINSGAAAQLHAQDDLDFVLRQIYDNPLRIQQMKDMAAYLARPYACEEIVTLMKELVSAQKSALPKPPYIPCYPLQGC